MDTKKLFDAPLKLGRKFGLSLNYKQEGKFMKFLAICCYLVMFRDLIYRLNYIFKGGQSISNLSDVTSNTLANIEAIMKVSSFYINSNEYLFLMETVKEKLKEGL